MKTQFMFTLLRKGLGNTNLFLGNHIVLCTSCDLEPLALASFLGRMNRCIACTDTKDSEILLKGTDSVGH